MSNQVGEKVIVKFPGGYGKVERRLMEDQDGLYIRYMGQRIAVRPETNWMGEQIRGFYVGRHPRVQEQITARR